ncbi:MAG TPA: TlpA disulfide reductase family protein [Fimbriimonadaceae bacterium]|jgi:thiol-disulfide isomerase/thioredoxin
MIYQTLKKQIALISGIVVCASAFSQGAKSTATLQMDPKLLDFAGAKAAGWYDFPSGVTLSSEKPAMVTKEPKYEGTVEYGTFTLGTGPKAVHALAIDQPANGDAKIYFDVKGDGDLTSGGDGTWQGKSTNDGLTEYKGTYVFRVSYGTPSHETGSTNYGLNFYFGQGRTSIFYFRAGARTGKIKIGDQEYTVKVIENDNDAVYNKAFQEKGKSTKPEWLLLDEAMIDPRGTFALNGMNYEATINTDGSKLTLATTTKAVAKPSAVAPKEPDLLAVGTMAPDFDVPAYDGGTVKLSSLRGKVVVLDFWATWCVPCKQSLPHLDKVQQQVKDKGVYVLALNVFDDKKAYDQWIPNAGKAYTFHWAFDPAGRGEASIAKSKYLVSGIPTTYVIGTDGKIAASIVGFDGLDDHRLEKALAALNIPITVPGATKSVPMIGFGGKK